MSSTEVRLSAPNSHNIDLKIENILISQTGNIKIIDFGLSNLYDPLSHLGTFCGSLYFAAPELLNAKVYTGPEVDVWSFGVVLYVLVCGKVPFDDQSMPALHAKIKRGLVEYPVWLSAECKHLLSRMLVTNPSARATLSEVMNHAWMTRGSSGPPDSHLVHREPLRVDDIDRQVIRGMKGFEFGTDENVERKLIQVLESEGYQRAVAAWEQRRNGGLSNSSLTLAFDATQSVSPKKSKRFSGFDFYRRKLFSPASSPPGTPFSQSPPSSSAHLGDEPVDPTRGFHPLISIYYLAREKLERERVYGAGVFASSQLSLEEKNAQEETNRRSSVSIPIKPPAATTKADYSMPLPRLPAPASSHYSDMSPSPTTPGFAHVTAPSPTASSFGNQQAQPRARDTGHEGGLGAPRHPEPVPSAAAETTNLPRAPPASTHRRSHSLSQRPTTTLGGHFEPPRTADPTVRSFAEKMVVPVPEEAEERELKPPSSFEPNRPRSPSPLRTDTAKDASDEPPPTPTLSTGATLVRRFGSLLLRHDDSRRHSNASKRASILSPRPSGEGPEPEKPEEKPEEKFETPKQVTHSVSQPLGNTHRRAATILEGRTTRHERRSSTGAALMSHMTGGSIGRHRRPSTGYGTNVRPSTGLFARTEEVDEPATVDDEAKTEGDMDALKSKASGRENFKDEDERHTSEKDFKPVYLKGLFR